MNKSLFRPLYMFGMGLALLTSNLNAMPASPHAKFEQQPDGTVIQLMVRGDEHFNWSQDLEGYTVVREKNGWYKYATLNNGRLVASQHAVGKSNPKALGLSKNLLPSADVRKQTQKSVSSIQAVPPSGDIRNLVVMIRFADHAGRGVPSENDLNILFNAAGGDPQLAPTGSVRDVYLENSYGQMRLNSTIAAWVTVSGTESYYANGVSGDQTLWEGLREALDVVDQTLDFSQFDTDNDGRIDAITFLHSGYGAEWGGTDAYGSHYNDRIWSHRWTMTNWTSDEGVSVSDYHISPAVWGTSGSAIGRIGVIAHETGHFFGLPDLYDTNSGGAGIGSFGLMANSWDFQGTQRCPPHFSPWSKERLGWYQATVISQDGEYSLNQAESHPEVYKITQGFPSGEYLLIENRQNAGFDCTLPQGGLAIWHIDELAGYNTEGYPGQSRWPENGNHYKVALLQADGNYHLERGNNRGDSGDLYHGLANNSINPGPGGHPNTDTYQRGQINQTNISINNISLSNASMSFCLNDCDPGSGDPLAAPSNLTATVTRTGKGKNAQKSVRLNWQDNATSEDSYVVERCKETGKGRTKVCNFAPIATLAADSNSYTEDPGSGTFIYRVKAIAGSSASGYSNEVKI